MTREQEEMLVRYVETIDRLRSAEREAKVIEREFCEGVTGVKQGRIVRLKTRTTPSSSGKRMILTFTVFVEGFRFTDGGRKVFLRGRAIRRDRTIVRRNQANDYEVDMDPECAPVDVTDEFSDVLGEVTA